MTFRKTDDPGCQWTVAVSGRNLHCDFEAGHSNTIKHCNAETGHMWWAELPTAEEMICECGHDFLMHPVDREYPFDWHCIEPLCPCEEWQEIRHKANKLPVDICGGV